MTAITPIGPKIAQCYSGSPSVVWMKSPTDSICGLSPDLWTDFWEMKSEFCWNAINSAIQLPKKSISRPFKCICLHKYHPPAWKLNLTKMKSTEKSFFVFFVDFLPFWRLCFRSSRNSNSSLVSGSPKNWVFYFVVKIYPHAGGRSTWRPYPFHLPYSEHFDLE